MHRTVRKRRNRTAQRQTEYERNLGRYLRLARQAGCPPDQVANFRRANYTAQPRQLLFHAAARMCDERDGPTQVGFGGARGGAKTHAMVEQLAADDCQRMPGLKCLLLRKVGKAVKESFDDLRTRLLSKLPHKYVRRDATLTFPNGSRIVLGHFQRESDIDAYLGLEYDVIGVEETTTLSRSKYLAIRTCNRTSREDWRPRIYTNTNPGGVGHQWYKGLYIVPFRRDTEEDTRFVPSTVDDNAFVNPEYRRTLDDLTGWQYRAWRLGDWDIAAGQFFVTFQDAVHVVPAVAIEEHWRLWLAMDYGFTHWNVIHLLAHDPHSGVVYVVDELAERRWLVGQHADAVTAMLQRHGVAPYRLEVFVTGRDCFSTDRDGKTIADDWKAAGWFLTPANVDRVNGAAEILRRLGNVEAGQASTLAIMNRCQRLVDCLPILEHNPHRPEDVLKIDTDSDGIGGDDAYDSARYGLMAIAGGQRTLTEGASPTAGYRG